MVNINALRYIKNKPGTPAGSISTPDKKTISKESILGRDAGKTLAKGVGIAKGAYDSTIGGLAQIARMLGRIPVSTAQSVGNKITGNNNTTLTDTYDRATSFVDKPDEFLEDTAINLAGKDWGNIKLQQGEGLGMAATLLSPLTTSRASNIGKVGNLPKATRATGTSNRKTLDYAQDYLNNAKGGDWSIKETADYLKNTSRARAAATKKRNMSAQERAARERAEDSANEIIADRLKKEAGNTPLDDMYEYWKSQRNG